jgi:transcriptional regulator with XRE-family HTH domain
MEKRGNGSRKLERAFSEVLREIRTERGLSQEKVALEAGYHRTYVGMLERGLQNPTLRTILSLATVLNVSGAVIVERVETKLKAK